MIFPMVHTAHGVHPRASVVKPATQRMQPSVFRRLQLATFAFLAAIVVALVISAALRIREAQQLSVAQQQLGRFHEFDRMQLIVTRRLTTLAEGDEQTTPRGQPLLSKAIDRMMALSSDPDAPAKLRALRARVEQPGA